MVEIDSREHRALEQKGKSVNQEVRRDDPNDAFCAYLCARLYV